MPRSRTATWSRTCPRRGSQSSTIPSAVAARFRTLADLPWPVWLDSAAQGVDSTGRFDILVADPYVTLRTRGTVTEIRARDGAASTSTRPPLELLREQLGERAVRRTWAAVLRRCRRLSRLRPRTKIRTDSGDRGRRHRHGRSRRRSLRLGRGRRPRAAAQLARRRGSRSAHVRRLAAAACARAG